MASRDGTGQVFEGVRLAAPVFGLASLPSATDVRCAFLALQLKAYRHKDGSVRIFRPTENAARMNHSAQMVCMPELPEALFLETTRLCAAANLEFVPPYGPHGTAGSLYMRPLYFGSGGNLALGPPDEFTLCVLPPRRRCYPGMLLGRSLLVADAALRKPQQPRLVHACGIPLRRSQHELPGRRRLRSRGLRQSRTKRHRVRQACWKLRSVCRPTSVCVSRQDCHSQKRVQARLTACNLGSPRCRNCHSVFQHMIAAKKAGYAITLHLDSGELLHTLRLQCAHP